MHISIVLLIIGASMVLVFAALAVATGGFNDEWGGEEDEAE